MADRILSFKEYLQREIPLHNRLYSQLHPITSLINLVMPLLMEQEKEEIISKLNRKIRAIEGRVGRKIIVIENWLQSSKTYIKILSVNKWGKPVYKKVFRREVEDLVTELNIFIYREIIYALLYKKGINIFEIKKRNDAIQKAD